MARVYATVDEYQAYPGALTATAQTAGLLAKASRMLERLVLRYCVYDVDTVTGLPTHPVVAAAFRDAVCAQVAWWDRIGDSSGADAVGWGSVAIGSVQLGRSVTAVSGEDAAARQLAPEVLDALNDPALVPDIFWMGAVTSC
ncbi:hypothetical protein [Streptomyces sp. SID161]|uniref:hypothetical protein n=1 Tax=Streptomyces sp. SID161 TaxID=2690251 RepID=UPI00136C2729|nr:hypothetical protein [Streptomyces sp. SID161]MYW48881.1 hypothetical protein [Streptomyces sp. SID161]MYW49834.1 hypothetical protein [Streptomyces sp. SID161]